MKIATLQRFPSARLKMTLGGTCIVAFFFFCCITPAEGHFLPFGKGKQSAGLSTGTLNRAEARTHFYYRRTMATNRKRNKTITIRVTEKEWMAIMEKCLLAGMNLTDYLITAALRTEIHVPEDTKPLLAELKRIGNNLNQITVKINAGAFRSYNFEEVTEALRKIYEEVYRIGRDK